MQDLGPLILRLTLGGFLAGHGAQKLFGAFGGHGLEGTGHFMEQLGFRPGRQWALTAGLGEFGGGVLTAIGFLHPIGPITTLAPMTVAWLRAHRGKPIWVTAGGGELPVTNMAIALSLALMGPGKFSVDGLFRLRPHPALAILAGAAVAGGTLMALSQPVPEPAPPPDETPQPTESNTAAQEPNPVAAT